MSRRAPLPADRLGVAFLAAGVWPFSAAGPGAEWVGAVAVELARLGHRVRVFSPAWSRIDRDRFKLARSAAVPVTVAGRADQVHVEHLRRDDVDFHFVGHGDYYDRAGYFGDGDGPYVDNAERFAYLVHAALAWLRASGAPVDVVHASDWPTALAPILLALPETPLGPPRPATVLTVHDLEAQGIFHPAQLVELGLPRRFAAADELGFYDRLNLLQGGIRHADRVTVTSPTWAEEILTEDRGFGLEAALARCQSRLGGVLGGIHPASWDPQRDLSLKASFGATDLIGKRSCKLDLQAELGLASDVDAVVVAVHGPLTRARGAGLVMEALSHLLGLGVQLVVLGPCEPALVERLERARVRHGGMLAHAGEASEILWRKLLGGADILLAPALSEASGREVLQAQRYGTIPVAHRTGACADRIVDRDRDPARCTGFLFSPWTAEALLDRVGAASELRRRHPGEWQQMVLRAMQVDGSWATAARAWEQVYRQALAGRSS